MQKQIVSLVLSGGGARGLAHIGVIEELNKQGFKIGAISGTSMGAVIGGVYALDKMQEYKKWMYSLDRRKVFSLVDFTWNNVGLIKGDRVFSKMMEFIPDKNIEDLEIPFTAIATDIFNNKEVEFKEGSIYTALRASVAIPNVITPAKYKDTLLVDGGVLNNIPIANVQRQKNDILVVVDVNADIPVLKPKQSKKQTQEQKNVYLKKLKYFYQQLRKVDSSEGEVKPEKNVLSYFNLLDKTINLMIYKITANALKEHNPEIVIKVSREASSTYDFYKAEELVEIGRLAAQKALSNYNV